MVRLIDDRGGSVRLESDDVDAVTCLGPYITLYAYSIAKFFHILR